MRQLTITVTDSEYSFIKKLLGKLPGVTLEKTKRMPPAAKKPLTPEHQDAGLR